VVIVADYRAASRDVCLHWLPYWLPKISLPSLTFEWSKAMSSVCCLGVLPASPAKPSCNPSWATSPRCTLPKVANLPLR
jgi:hypothetical protein